VTGRHSIGGVKGMADLLVRGIFRMLFDSLRLELIGCEPVHPIIRLWGLKRNDRSERSEKLGGQTKASG